MRRPTPLLCLLGKSLLLFLVVLSLSSCYNLKRGIQLAEDKKFSKAQAEMCDYTKGNSYKSIVAEYYCTRAAVAQTNDVNQFINYAEQYCNLEQRAGQLTRREQINLKKHNSSQAAIRNTKENLQNRIFERMSQSSTIDQLLHLEEYSACWTEGKLDSLRKIIPNKTIDPDQVVYPDEIEWESPPLDVPDEAQILTSHGLSCIGMLSTNPWGLSYDDAITIAQMYADYVLPANYDTFWEIQYNIWTLFQTYNSYCNMDRFKMDYPDYRIVKDCWYDEAAEVLCADDLKQLLAFHRNTPHTALDQEICIHILCLTGKSDAVNALNTEERNQLEDIRTMLQMKSQLQTCHKHFNDEELIANVVDLAQKYPQHALVFDLAMKVLDYFATQSIFTKARKALEQFRPLFDDVKVCDLGFYFQEGKQRWFDNFETLLERGVKDKLVPQKMEAWNTPDQDEYSLVSWGETEEVFFVRRNREKKTAQIMTSQLKGAKWTKPAAVVPLSFAEDVEPLSISSEGRMILLKSEGKLYRSVRQDIGRRWSRPELLPTPNRFAGNAWISPDDSLLVMDYYSTPLTVVSRPSRDIHVAKLRPNDLYSDPVPMSSPINLSEFREGKPVLALGGRTLFYTSDYLDPLDNVSMYRVNFDQPNDWTTAGKPLNIGLPINTIFDDSGITYLSAYTNHAYFYRKDRCSEDIDIWRTQLASEVFPQNAMRLAGIVLDENDKPIGGGFMEFMTNHERIHSKPISNEGTYNYTVVENTEVVRLFPEIPGYYSERDATHYLAQIEKGDIIRDTFRLTSYGYILKNFELRHSTFFNGLAEFDQPEKAYPEITRLSKIAERMGAELELIGHTDNSGEAEDNERLSYNRALSVKQYLVDKCGFDAARIRVEGKGASEPRCTNDTEEGQRCNRRVQVVFKMPELPNKL